MSSYVLSFRNHPDVTASQEEVDEWGAWFQSLGGTVTDMGSRIGSVTLLGEGAGANALSGYVVIDAADSAKAVDIASSCPGLRHGGSVEIGEQIAM
jgi:hypothetical protein